MRSFQIQILMTESLSAEEIRVHCALSSSCALASALLVAVVGRLTELSVWADNCQCSCRAAQTAFQGGLCIPAYLL